MQFEVTQVQGRRRPRMAVERTEKGSGVAKAFGVQAMTRGHRLVQSMSLPC